MQGGFGLESGIELLGVSTNDTLYTLQDLEAGPDAGPVSDSSSLVVVGDGEKHSDADRDVVAWAGSGSNS